MTLFTGKGDNGTTKILGREGKVSKSSNIAEALGSLDEINSFLGLCKVQSAHLGYKLEKTNLSDIVHDLQKNLFIIQAELAGADKTIEEEKVKEVEEIINQIEKKLPPIKSFFISGGPSEMTKNQMSGAGLAAIFDIARTIARRAERRVITVAEEMLQPTLLNKGIGNNSLPLNPPTGGDGFDENRGKEIGKHTRSYLNRLSSILYALARYSNYLAGISEEAPDYR